MAGNSSIVLFSCSACLQSVSVRGDVFVGLGAEVESLGVRLLEKGAPGGFVGLFRRIVGGR